ncbi:ABC transporter ATP-binding protein [Streptomyces albireticuli]|uniref:ABC-type xenobiotic transporter n=1 Tax=Streptomyces albireticuli TaxID=1940 RepID=A0A2A2CZK5_9ACTN|nr:ABC transporter ATP-binding protein [Streptomyces albireticuli]MCD9140472.1 ABC transporter ATP-binding protein [Streptomyces albireticuli]MCD9161566.1 ABC transporter ATP-binding protein [Streptomyces albireticuli]MCD9192864.1 ABC transporter ATP-binding protein [Streptomyces albireticuli]PAU44512.1 ABC transporter [Streptomyces albireticuli]
MAETAVRVRGLRKVYGDHVAVDGLDLDIRRGEIFGILGPNGAGKSTTVEILEGHRTRDAGEVDVLGEDPGKASRRWKSRIGIVWQNEVVIGDTTVAETVRHFARYFPDPRDPEEIIDLVGLTEKANARVSGLSGGQRRRVDVAIGVIGRPELLFLDEPTTGFDPAARRQFWDLIRSLADGGTSIVLTSHYLDEVEALADRLAVVVKGKVVAEGDPATLGGRASAQAQVSWLGADGPMTHRTDSPTTVVAELAAYFKGEIPELTVTRPSLEDIYLGLIKEQETAA